MTGDVIQCRICRRPGAPRDVRVIIGPSQMSLYSVDVCVDCIDRLRDEIAAYLQRYGFVPAVADPDPDPVEANDA